MSNFSVKATFDGQELIQGFKDVKTEINGLKTAGDNAGKSLGQMLQQKNSSSDYRRQLSLITRELTDLTINYRRLTEAEQQSEFGQGLKLRIDELTAKASEFKDAMLDVQQSISESASDTANWDAFQSLIDITASSLQTFAGMAGLSEDSTAALNRSIGIMMTTGAAANTVIKVGNALQKTSALMLGVVRVQNAAAAAAINIKTASEGKSIVVTKAATVAQSAFNAVAKANPYVLLATVILGVGAALVGFVKKTKAAEKEQEEYNKQIEEQKEKEKERAQVVGRHVGDVISKYNLLRNEWVQLRTEEEKNEWIRNNADAFADLGLNVSNAALANKAFVDTADDVITALRLQAEAEALRELYVQNYGKAVEKQIELEKKQAEAREKWQSGYKPTGAEKSQYGVRYDDYNSHYEEPIVDDDTNWFVRAMIGASVADGAPASQITGQTVYHDDLSSSGAARIREKIVSDYQTQIDAGFEDANRYLELMNEKNTAAVEAAKKAGVVKVPSITGGGKGGSTSGSTSSTETKRTLQDELAVFNAAMAEQDNLYKEGIISQEEYYRNKKQVTQKYIQSIIALDGDITPEQKEQIQLASQLSTTFNNQLVLLEKQRKLQEDKTKNMNEFATTTAHVQQLEEEGILSATEAREQQYNAAKKYYNFLVSNWSNLTDEEKALTRQLQQSINAYDELKTKVPRGRTMDYYKVQNDKAQNVLADYDAGIIDKDAAKRAIDDINADLESLGLKPILININTERAMQAIDGLAAHFEVLNTIGSAVSSINSVYEAFKSLPDAMAEAENGWERFMVGFEAGMTVLNAITSVFGMINTLITTFNTIQAISTALKTKDAAASGVQVAASTAAATAAGTEAAANTAAAVSGAAKSVSWIPIVGAVLAVAAIAAVVGGIIAATNKAKFATGGIVPGNRIGDMNMVRVNGGEMILNGRQQKNLFTMLDQNRLPQFGGGSADVNFRIQGDALVGVIENYNKKRSRR